MLLHEETRLIVVTRWLEWLGVNHGIHNVINAHQCFNENPRTIVRPFYEESNFYGCLKCGKYHFCYNSHHTCDSVAPTLDINNNMPTCVYSGRTIRNIHNEVIGNYARSESLKSDVRHGVHMLYSESVYNSSGPKGSAAAETRRMNSLESMIHYKNGARKKKNDDNGNSSPSKKERRLIDKQNMNQYFFKRDNEVAAAASSLPIITTTNETVHEEMATNIIDLNCIEEFGVSDYDDSSIEADDECSLSCDHVDIDPTTMEGIMLMNEQLDQETGNVALLYDTFVHDMPYGGDDDEAGGQIHDDQEEDAMLYDDRLIRMKNPHDNVVFWDQYYSFLVQGGPLPVFTIERDMTTQDEESMTGHNNTNTAIEEGDGCRRTNGYLYDTSRPHHHLFRLDPSRWNNYTSVIIREEVRRIIDIIMRTYILRNKSEAFGESEYKTLLKRLTLYYHNIVSNIVILIYHSPHIEKMALQRHEKHEKQGKSSYSAKITVTVTDISALLGKEVDVATDDEEGDDGQRGTVVVSNPLQYQNARDLVCPKKVCASLMLHLFTELFFLCDSMTNHICVWVKDPWLTHMKNEVFNEIIMDYNIIVDPLNHNKKRGGVHTKSYQYENIFFKKDLTAMSTTIRASLSAYNCHPMWLSNMIYNFKRQ